MTKIVTPILQFRYVILPAILILIFCSLVACQDNPQQYLDSGDEYLAAEQTGEAINEYSKAIDINPELATAYYKRGMAYRSQEAMDNALQDFNRAIEIDPDYAMAYHARSLVYILQDEDEFAIEDMNHAINLDGNVLRDIDEGMSLAYCKLGVAYQNMGGYLLAQGFLGKSLTLEPTIDAYMARAEVHMFREGYHQASADLTKVIAMSPDLAAAYSRRGAAYIKEGELSLAKDDLDKAISLDSGNAEDYRNRAYLYLQQEDNVSALNDLNKAIALNPEDDLSYSYRGQIHLANVDYEKALDDFTSVLKYSSDMNLVMQANDSITQINSVIDNN
jgi:tetratricopeptide (TPR) repeat protein